MVEKPWLASPMKGCLSLPPSTSNATRNPPVAERGVEGRLPVPIRLGGFAPGVALKSQALLAFRARSIPAKEGTRN